MSTERNWATHPGEHIKEIIELRGHSQARFARDARITPKLLSTIIKRRARVSAATAIKLGKATGHSAIVWMNLQAAWDLRVAQRRKRT